MAKRKKLAIPPSVVKFILLLAVIFLLGLGVYRAVINLLTQASFFKINAVMIDPSLQFIDRRDLVSLTGRNIFTINLQEIERKLTMKYPQMAQVKIVRRFPDQIQVVARKRVAIARIAYKSKTLTLDDKGVVLASNAALDNNLPLIQGITYDNRVSVGWPIASKDLLAVLEIIKMFEANPSLKAYNILKVNVESLSKIEIYLSAELSIIIDREKPDQKLEMLALMFSQGQLNFKQIRYIDLRFKEPIIGKRNAAENKI